MKNNISNQVAGSDESPEEYARADRLATMFDLCAKTIRRWADQGKFARYKPTNGVVLFSVSEVKDFIRKSRLG